MKVADFKIFPVRNPPPARGGAQWLFIKLLTDDGIDGIGEIYGVPFAPATIATMAEDIITRRVIGCDPHRIEQLWHRVYADGYTQRPDISVMGILSAVEMALWDIIGKAQQKPVSELLGGRVRDTLRTYTYLYPQPEDDGDAVYHNADLAAKRAAEYIAQGFTAIKFDPLATYTAYDPRPLGLAELTRAQTITRRVREAVGDAADLLIGTHGQMNADDAIRLAHRLQPYYPLWLEEPTPPAHIAAMAKVAAAGIIPVATGERLTTKYEFAEVLAQKAASILQINCGRVGGLLEAKKIAAMAQAHYAQIAPHLYCGPVVAAANIQLAACSPNFLILESIYKMDGFHSTLLKQPLQWQDGNIIVPTAPGLGVELNEDVATANAANAADDSRELHINPLPNEYTPKTDPTLNN